MSSWWITKISESPSFFVGKIYILLGEITIFAGETTVCLGEIHISGEIPVGDVPGHLPVPHLWARAVVLQFLWDTTIITWKMCKPSNPCLSHLKYSIRSWSYKYINIIIYQYISYIYIFLYFFYDEYLHVSWINLSCIKTDIKISRPSRRLQVLRQGAEDLVEDLRRRPGHWALWQTSRNDDDWGKTDVKMYGFTRVLPCNIYPHETNILSSFWWNHDTSWILFIGGLDFPNTKTYKL